MSQDFKFKVKIYASPKPKKIPKAVSDELKTAKLGAKSIKRMKGESVDCPVVNQEVGFLVCFSCPSFVRRVMGVVDCAGAEPPPKEWLLG
jgi:hypothetical protein